MAAPLTLVNARGVVRSLLDDKFSRRWTDAQVNDAINGAVEGCVEEYVRAGGTAFDEEQTNINAAANVGADLSALDPLKIRAVLVVLDGTAGPWTWPVHAADPELRGVIDSTSRTLTIRFVRRPPVAVADGDSIVDLPKAAAGVTPATWPLFDRWCCMRAAQELGVTDDELRQSLMAVEQRVMNDAVDSARIPKSRPWPRERRRWLYDLRWLWTPGTRVLSLHLAGLRGW